MAQQEISSLDSLLSEEKLNSLNRFLDVIVDMDKIGLTDVLKGILEDEDTLGKIVGALTSDNVLALVANVDKVINFLNKVISDEDLLNNIDYLMNFVSQLRKTGLLDVVHGFLNDEEYLGKVIGAVTSDEVLNLITNWKSLVSFLNGITAEEKLSAISRALELLEKLNKLGILDVLNGILEDEDTLGKIIGAVTGDFTLNLVSKWNALSNALNEALKEENIKPVTGIFDIYRLLKDKDVQRGLGLVFSILKQLGKVV
ncbi:MAG: DUF1641 domain-containing protein [Sulfolobaceae archaeon]|nr:DUF1641 domain-containing protein [Sulfolobaceae archaeon]